MTSPRDKIEYNTHIEYLPELRIILVEYGNINPPTAIQRLRLQTRTTHKQKNGRGTVTTVGVVSNPRKFSRHPDHHTVSRDRLVHWLSHTEAHFDDVGLPIKEQFETKVYS